ncbi:hypothetical protein Alfi_2844 [Alistipes finegoldii DSM 17242]|uniref:Uncharacterized protein n=1 Tax=Alistipes finegoldii (strain DSM 17242 / JCM 16770 / CCUG 46020 / CIP 107999 / KCTC 15236 / AHN 2437) TaxID=679935 RepID=I3YQ28_ALIFI|nr:hypothetical protein Alfi_2844 [Alistipes finegoldii DSM 17242]
MSLIVYIFSVFCPCRRSSSALRVRSAGHVLNLNKGCTKRQSLPNCQQNGRPGREYRPGKQDARCYFVRNGAATKLRKAEAFSRKGRPTEPLRNDTASSSRRHAGRDSADTKAVVRTERQRKEVRRRATGYRRRTTNGKRWTMDGATGDGQQAARGWTAMDGDGRRWTAMDGDGRRWTAGERSKEWRKKNQTEYRRRRTDRQSWRAAGRESYGQRELRAEGATGRGSYGQRELRAGKRKT